MQLTAFGYYSDFIVYPLIIGTLAWFGLASATWTASAAWLGICLASIALWTLVEYLLHRYAFHRLPGLEALHASHHNAEDALLGTPVWFSLSAHILLILVPVWLIAGFAVASAVSSGLMIGYLWYATTHHALHHWHPRHSGMLYRLKRHHALHHYGNHERNFGVTTTIWDEVFRTSMPTKSGSSRFSRSPSVP